jgi:hypothetical protein
VRRLKILPCPEPPADAGPGRWFCERCEQHVTDVASLDDRGLAALLEQAPTTRTCARFEVDRGRPRLATGLAAGLTVVALSGCATIEPQRVDQPEISCSVGDSGICGVVRNPGGYPLPNVIVVLQSTVLPRSLEILTDERGVYSFGDLPPGTYTIQALLNKADVSKIIEVPPERVRIRANFTLDPDQADIVIIGMFIERPLLDTTSAASTHRLSDWWMP